MDVKFALFISATTLLRNTALIYFFFTHSNHSHAHPPTGAPPGAADLSDAVLLSSNCARSSNTSASASCASRQYVATHVSASFRRFPFRDSPSLAFNLAPSLLKYGAPLGTRSSPESAIVFQAVLSFRTGDTLKIAMITLFKARSHAGTPSLQNLRERLRLLCRSPPTRAVEGPLDPQKAQRTVRVG